MLETSILYILLRSIPEGIAFVLAGMIVLEKKINKIDIIKYGVILALTVTAIRQLPIDFGVHTILAMIPFGLMNFKLSDGDLIKSIIATCIVWIALALSEGIYILITVVLLGMNFEALVDKNSIYAAIITLPSLLIMLGIVYSYKKIEDKTSNNMGKAYK